jgi:hypothetical protein
MPALFEVDQVGKKDSLSDIIAVVDAEACPFTSVVAKRSKTVNKLHHWQMKTYPRSGHKGVMDGVDATNWKHNGRKEVWAVAQKIWSLPAVSDFAEETEVAGLSAGEMAGQIADGVVDVKRQTEMRCLSNEESSVDDGNTVPNETRGLFKWVQNTAQTHLPVDAAFLTPAASIYTGTCAALSETLFKDLFVSAYKVRKAPCNFKGFVGVELKKKISSYGAYSDDVASKTNVRTFSQEADKKVLLDVIDRIVLDTGTIDLFLAAFLYCDETTGADTAYTHKSGLFLDMSMIGMATNRRARVTKQEYKGGGEKAIVDEIFMLMCDNPSGMVAAKSNS